MASPFIAQITMFAGNFAPRGWAFCDGQLLSIASNTALFSLVGTIYGGDGRVTFGLPDLRGRVAMHPGSGPGLTPRTLGQKAGSENAPLLTHTHTVNARAAAGDESSPIGSLPAVAPADIYSADPASGTMNAGMINPAGAAGGGPNGTGLNVQPFQCVNFIIALQGIFPSRN